jgi:hypothetical protein
MSTVFVGNSAPPNVRHEPWPQDSGPELMVWLVTSDAEPWLPTTRELRHIWEERNAPAPVDEPPEHPDGGSSADAGGFQQPFCVPDGVLLGVRVLRERD